MPYTAGQADLTTGPQIAAQGIQNSMSGITQMLQKVGMMHLQDRQAGAQLDAFKAAGYFDPQPGQGPESAMMPAALYSAAQKGPLGTKTAMAGVMQNYLQMNYEMKMARMKFGYEQGGVHQGSGQQPQGQQQTQQQPAFDSSKGPASGMNSVPWNPTGSGG
jgi:hypothetical protein